jgi:uncharacterized protein YqfA (UPF0365 family)
MTMSAVHQVTLHITPLDRDTLERFAAADRRRITDTIRLLLEDVIDGKIDIAPPAKIEKATTAVRMNDELKAKLDEFKAKTKISADKALHLALAKLRAEGKVPGYDQHLDYQEGITEDRRAPKNQIHQDRATYNVTRT